MLNLSFRFLTAVSALFLFDSMMAQNAVLVAPTGHQKDIRALVKADRFIATAGDDGRVILWDATSGRQMASALFNGEAAAIALAPDEKTLAVGVNYGDETGIYLFNMPTLSLRKKIAAELAPKGLAYVNNGKNLVSAGWDGTLAFLDAQSGAILNRLQPTSGEGLELLVVSPDGKWVAAGDQSNGYVLNVSELGKPSAAVYTLSGFGGGLISAQFSPKSDALALLDANGNLSVSSVDGSRSYWQKQFDNLPKSLVYRPDGTALLVLSFDGVQVYSASAGTLQGSIKTEPDNLERLFPASDALFWAVQASGTAYKFKTGQSKPALALSRQVANGSRLAVGGKPMMIGSCGLLEPTSIWDLQSGQLVANLPNINTPTAAISLDGKNIFAEHEGVYEVFDQKGKSAMAKKLSTLGGGGLVLSSDGKTACTSGATMAGQTQILVLDPTTGAIKKTINAGTGMVISMALNKDGSILACSRFETGVQLYDTRSGSTLGGLSDSETGLPINAASLAFSPSGKWLAMTGANSKVFLFETSSQRQVWQWEDENFTPVGEGLAFSSDEKTLLAALTGADANIVALNVSGGKENKRYSGHVAAINSIAFLPGDQAFVSSSQDLTIRLWKINQTKEAAQLYAFTNSRDWVVVTPDGRFDGSQNGIAKLYFSKDGAFIPLESLYEKFYTPGLIASLVTQQTSPTPTPEKRKEDVNTLKKAPTVSISYAAGQKRNLTVEDDMPSFETTNAQALIQVEAKSPDDVIAEIRVFHNGKIIQGSTRNLTVEDDQPSNKNESRNIEITLEPGENRFKAIALNAQRTESLPYEISVVYKPAVAPAPASAGIAVHLIVVGINQYKNPKYNLNYAQADAQAFKEAVSTGMKGITPDIQVHFVSDAQADKAGILAEFETVKKAAKPRDVLVFYYAGHGVVAESGTKDFYLVPHDVTQLYGADDALAQKGISAMELKNLAASIPAQKQLFILDACQSAGALGAVARGAAEEKAIAQLARSTGTHWLTAAGSEQFATEFAQLGHGVFTYALVEGLKGQADNGDKKITVNELKSYLESAVPELTQKYKGTPQFPSSYGFGQDFPLGTIINK